MRGLWGLLRAFAMAAWGHRHQRDKGGRLYWHHLVRVAWLAYGLSGGDLDAAIVGLLHDYLEDVDPHAGAIIARCFGGPVARAVSCLTRPGNVSYGKYIARIAAMRRDLDDRVLAVKLADLLDNTQPGRVDPESYDYRPNFDRLYGYIQALAVLTARRALRGLGV